MTPILFYTDDIELDVHTATQPHHIGHLSLRQFAEWCDSPVSLYKTSAGDLFAEAGIYPNKTFIEGQEI